MSLAPPIDSRDSTPPAVSVGDPAPARRAGGLEPWALGLAIALFALALAARMFRIGQESFFIDEALTRKACLGDIWNHIKTVELTPPLHLLLAAGWTEVFGSGHVALRSLSAIGGAVASPLLFLTLRRLGSTRAASVAAGAIFAFAPVAVWYGQQARAYALLMTAVALWIYLVVRVWQTPSRPAAALLGLSVFLGFSIHYYFVFPILGGLSTLAGFLLARRERGDRWKTVIAPQLLAMAAWAIYLPVVRAQLATGNINWLPRPGWGQFFQVYTEIFLVGPFDNATDAMRPWGWLILAGIVAGGIRVWFRTNDTAGERTHMREAPESNEAGGGAGLSSRREHRVWLAFFVAVAVAPVLVPFLASVLGPRPIFLKDRYTVSAFPAFLLLAVFALDRWPLRWGRWVPIFAGALLFLGPGLKADLRYWTTLQDFDWRGAARIVAEEGDPARDTLIFIPGWMRHTFEDNGGRWTGTTIDRDIARRVEELMRDPIDPTDPSDPSDSPATAAQPPRAWLFVWENTPDPAQLDAARSLEALPGSRCRVEWPHIRLWETPLKTRQDTAFPPETERPGSPRSTPSN